MSNKQYNRDHVIAVGNKLILGTVRRMYIGGPLVPGAGTRRAGPDGVKFWVDQFRNNGFNASNDSGNFIRIYPDDEDLNVWIQAFDTAKEGYVKAGIKVPLTGPELAMDPIEVKEKNKNTIDGGHRGTALQKLRMECSEEDDVSMYEYVNGIVYHPDVKYDASILGMYPPPHPPSEKINHIPYLNCDYTHQL